MTQCPTRANPAIFAHSVEAASAILGPSAIAVLHIGGNDFRDFSAAKDGHDPDTWLFWDDLHPTDAFHEKLATSFASQASEELLPADWPLLAAGLGLCGIMSRCRKSLA
ncbi:hypothetical protein [Silicimonas sp. MF1-12-2]|uniref:hypothetical protein n=1 Tax=Silicimonas sp. MF1-12-2 TaxID=3384793 RepID=UPI0039B377E6